MPQFDVFLSHSSIDKPWVIKLKDDLLRYGVSVWLDQDEIRPGDLFVEALEQALDNCRTVALIVSPNAISSGWVKEEYSRAMSLATAKQTSVQIIPIILQETELPGFLGNRNWVDFRDDALYAQNVSKLVWGITGNKPIQVLNLSAPDLPSIAHVQSARQTEVLPANTTTSDNSQLTITNPFYTNGRINNPHHFFGRERLVREIRGELKKRASVSLVGDSQLGKSSLLYYLYATRSEWLPDVTVKYIDLQTVLDEQDFCETVLAALGEKGEDLRHLKRALTGREVVLLFDEMERLAEQDFNPRLHDLLRALAQEPHFAMCLVTQRPLIEVFPARTAGGVSPFHNIFTVKTLGPFSEDEARTFLLDRLATTPITFTEAEMDTLLNQCQGHPAKLQQLAKALFVEKVA